MDIITHGVTGLLVGRALPGGGRSPIMAAALIGALAPDLDAIAKLWDPMATISAHRSATHSFVGGALIALAAAGVVRAFRREKFLSLLAAAYLGVLSHIALDLLNPFGTAVLWPFTDRRFSLGQHHVIDPVFSALALGFLILTFGSKDRRVFFTRMAFAGIALYLIVAAAHQRIAFSRWEASLHSQGIRPVRSTVIPLLPGPFRWLGVAESNELFYQQPFWLYESQLGPPKVFFKTADGLEHVEDLKEVQLFLRFARFPWRHVWQDGSLQVVEYRELAFADHPLGGPLSLRIWLDESNAVKKMELGHLF